MNLRNSHKNDCFRGLWLRMAFCICIFVPFGACSSFKSSSTDDKEVHHTAIPAPSKFSSRYSQFVFCADFPLKDQTALFQELGELREKILHDLQLPGSDSMIQVFLFEDQERYERYMKAHYPELPPRQAFFIAQPRLTGGANDLLVFTYWGDNIAQDLRHELTHAVLHSILHDVPLWLDEGLAEYFQLPNSQRGLNPAHMALIKQGPFAPNLSRLEQLTQVPQMKQPEYRESWAWVYFLMQSKPETKKVLLDYLRDLRGKHKDIPTMMSRLRELSPIISDDLIQYLDTMMPANLPTGP